MENKDTGGGWKRVQSSVIDQSLSSPEFGQKDSRFALSTEIFVPVPAHTLCLLLLEWSTSSRWEGCQTYLTLEEVIRTSSLFLAQSRARWPCNHRYKSVRPATIKNSLTFIFAVEPTTHALCIFFLRFAVLIDSSIKKMMIQR